MRIEKILSEFDGLGLEIAVIVPEGNPKGVIQFSHGMAEHKERYYDFMNYLSDHGYVCVIHDHRGHGGSVERQRIMAFSIPRMNRQSLRICIPLQSILNISILAFLYFCLVTAWVRLLPGVI